MSNPRCSTDPPRHAALSLSSCLISGDCGPCPIGPSRLRPDALVRRDLLTVSVPPQISAGALDAALPEPARQPLANRGQSLQPRPGAGQPVCPGDVPPARAPFWSQLHSEIPGQKGCTKGPSRSPAGSPLILSLHARNKCCSLHRGMCRMCTTHRNTRGLLGALSPSAQRPGSTGLREGF